MSYASEFPMVALCFYVPALLVRAPVGGALVWACWQAVLGHAAVCSALRYHADAYTTVHYTGRIALHHQFTRGFHKCMRACPSVSNLCMEVAAFRLRAQTTRAAHTRVSPETDRALRSGGCFRCKELSAACRQQR